MTPIDESFGELLVPFPAWISLDVPFDRAIRIVHETCDIVTGGYKAHASVEDALKQKLGKLRRAGAEKIWWDRKADDVASTVAEIGKTAVYCGVDRMTVHAAGGIEMMMAAVAHGPREIVAVTDLTSLEKAEIGMRGGMPVDASTLLKAHWAKLAGVSHLVCSCEEVGMLNRRRGHSKIANRGLELHGLTFVVPGSRTITTDMGSQKRSTTAPEALKNGADELVLGSEVCNADYPREALLKIYAAVATSRAASSV